MRIAFEELSVTANGAGYGFFSGEADIDNFGEPISFVLEAAAKGKSDLKLDIADLARERIGLRRKLGSGFLEDGSSEVGEHLKKWVLFHALSESLKVQYKEEIRDFLLDLWSPHAEPVLRRSQRFL